MYIHIHQTKRRNDEHSLCGRGIRIHIHTHMHIFTYIYTHIFLYSHIYTYIFMCIYTCLYIHIYIYQTKRKDIVQIFLGRGKTYGCSTFAHPHHPCHNCSRPSYQSRMYKYILHYSPTRHTRKSPLHTSQIPSPPKLQSSIRLMKYIATLQHTATHSDTQQKTATQCNAPLHPVESNSITHCNTLQHTATYCNTLQHAATHCITLHHTASHSITLQRTTTSD